MITEKEEQILVFEAKQPLQKTVRNPPKIKDRKGDLTWLAVSQLQIDRRYQRNTSNRKIVEMARNWSWVACGAIVVALRGDCSWWVVDGQHRTAAARMRGDIEMLPCVTFEMDDTPAEAQAFHDTNANRKMPTMVNKFNALLHAGNHLAEDVQQMISRTGHRIGDGNSGPFSVSCASALMQGMEDNPSAMRIVWPVIADLCRGRKVLHNIVTGMVYLERKLVKGQSLGDRRWHDRIVQVGYDKIVDSIRRAAAFRQNQGHISCAIGISEAVNHGLKIRLEHTILITDKD